MKDIKYKSREYKSEAVINKASEDIKIIAQSLLPKGYSMSVRPCDVQSENEFTPRYKYVASITPEHDSPHFVAYSRTENGVYAKVVEILFSTPIYPLY